MITIIKEPNNLSCIEVRVYYKSDVEYLQSDEGFHEIVRIHVEGILEYIKS